MKIQLLVPTMNETDRSLPAKMNVKSDTLITNQGDLFMYEEYYFNDHLIKQFSFNEKGVGLNRNNGLMRSTGDICLLADDDMVFVKNYPEIIFKAFNDNEDADVIIFNLKDNNENRFIINKPFKVNYLNFMRFGAARIAFRRRAVIKNGISFNLNFGGGTPFSSGEDSLFLADCLKKGLKIIAIPEYIASLTNERESTWFQGYNEKYFIDKGVFFATLSSKWAKLLCLQFAIRRQSLYINDYKWWEVYKLMLRGIKIFEKIR